MSDRDAAIAAAIVRLTADQFTRDGKPSVDALNAHIEAEEFEPVTAEERDALWAERLADAEGAGPMDAGLDVAQGPDDGTVNVTILTAPSEPLPLYVHGVGRYSLRPGQTYKLPADALDALRNSDCTFTTG